MDALGPIEILFLLAPWLVVPLALRLSSSPPDSATLASSAALRLQPWAATAVSVSFLLRRGPLAALLAAAWLAITGLVALHGALRLRDAAWSPPELAINAGCLMLPVGGGWLVLSRLGSTPLGFEEPLVLLTGVHFHYAAFAALVLVGLAGRAAGDGVGYRLIAAGAVAGPPLLAAGITAWPLVELFAASVLAAALSGLGILILLRVVPRLHGAARLLLAVSSVSAVLAMGCALAYALGEFTGVGIFSLARMARIHGPLNALGFAVAGLLGWWMAPRNLRPPAL